MEEDLDVRETMLPREADLESIKNRDTVDDRKDPTTASHGMGPWVRGAPRVGDITPSITSLSSVTRVTRMYCTVDASYGQTISSANRQSLVAVLGWRLQRGTFADFTLGRQVICQFECLMTDSGNELLPRSYPSCVRANPHERALS
nr:hypothetical protein CFP56_23794 [Quercus suber]